MTHPFARLLAIAVSAFLTITSFGQSNPPPDTTPPPTPILTSYDAASSTPSFHGTAEPLSTIKLYGFNPYTSLSTTTAADGSWNIGWSGPPLTSGNYTFYAYAVDAAGNQSSNISGIVVSIAPTAPPVVKQVSDVEVEYHWVRRDYDNYVFLEATNPPLQFAATGLPPGVTLGLHPSGSTTNNGVAIAALTYKFGGVTGGAFTVSITATNSVGTSAPMTFRWIVHPGIVGDILANKYSYLPGETIAIKTTFSAPVVVNGTPYIQLWGSKKAMYSSGSGTNALIFTYQVAADDPKGTPYSVSGITADGATIQTADGVSATLGQTEYFDSPPTFIVSDTPTVPVVTNATVTGTVGTPITPVQLQATNSPIRFTVASLADYGLQASASGLITGTPTREASGATASFTASNANGESSPGTITLNFASSGNPPPPVQVPVVSNATVTGQVGGAITPIQIAATNSPTAFSAPGLPAYGLSISNSGVISGTPTATADGVEVAVTASNAAGISNPGVIRLSIVSAPPPTTTPPPVVVQPPIPTKSNQTITFTSPVGSLIVGQPITLGAVSSAGLPISYEVVAGDATINSNVLTPTGTAALIVRAYSTGNGAYNASSTDVNFGTPQKAAQAITVGTSGGAVPAERPITLAATASSNLPVAYSVVSGPAAISGTTLTFTGTGTVTVRAAQPGDGTYQAAETTLTFVANPVDRLVNISSRLRLAPDAAHVGIAGFVVTGTTPKPILIRAIGPGLGAFGVDDGVRSPQLQLTDIKGRIIASNTGWNNDSQIAAAADNLGAFRLLSGSQDAAIMTTLAPGAYTAQVSSTSAGSVLIEVYDGSSNAAVPTRQLVNISTRGAVDASGSMIAGFVVRGAQSKRVLIRAVGPGLAAFGVSGVLADPIVKVYGANGTMIAQNDDWEVAQVVPAMPAPATAGQISAAEIVAGAFALVSGAKDAATVLTLAPGAYTAVVTGSNGATGAALVEVYELNDASK